MSTYLETTLPATTESDTLSADAPMAQVIVGPSALGQGVNSVTGAGANTCMVISQTSKPITNSQCYSRVCTTASEVQEAINLSGSLSAVIYGDTVEAKASYYQSLLITEYSVTLVVYAPLTSQVNATAWALQGSVPVDGIDAAQNPNLSDSQANDFFIQYGDSFVSSLTTGAEYIATYVFQTTNAEDQTSVSAKLQGMGFGGGLSASLQTQLNQITSNTVANSTFNQQQFGSDLPLPDPADIISFALKYASAATPDAARVTDFATTSYYPYISGSFQKIYKNVNTIVGDQYDAGLMSWADAIQSGIEASEMLQSLYTYYKGYVDGALNAYVTQAQTDAQAVTNILDGFVDNPCAPLQSHSFPSIQKGLPNLNYGFAVYYSRGGPVSPLTWNDLQPNQLTQNTTDVAALNLPGSPADPMALILSKTVIKDLQVFAGSDCNGIQITYSHAASTEAAANVPTTYASLHGNTNESSKPVAAVDTKSGSLTATQQFLSSLSCKINGSTIRHISVAAANGAGFDAGANDNSTATYSITFASNQIAIGFKGVTKSSFLYDIEVTYFWFNNASFYVPATGWPSSTWVPYQ